MKKNLIITVFCAVAAVTALLSNCNQKGGGYGQSTNAPTPCVAPASWFPHSQTPPPQEGANSPFANPTTTTNCDFHQWSWQKFLYLTQNITGNVARFEGLIQVNNQMELMGPVLTLIDSSQAGTHTILMDKSNRAVYYSVYMNDIMYKFAKKYVALFLANCDSAGMLSYTKLQSLGYDTLSYPDGSFEMKCAWMMASSIPSGMQGNFYMTNAILNKKPVKVALVGMHIVGKVINHPEMIWATYAHKNAAPTAKWPANYTVDSVLDTKQILSPNNYLFYNAGLSADSCEITKKPHVAGNFKSIYHLFDHGTQPPYNGILPNLKTQDSVNLANINSINQSVFSQLSVNDVWSNYEYFGSTWIDPTTAVLTPGNGNIGSLAAANLRGSRALSNIAAETYFQYNYFVSKKPIITRNSFNCFTCHNTSNQIGIGKKSYPFIIGLSHLFNNNLNKRLKSSRIEQPLIFQEK